MIPLVVEPCDIPPFLQDRVYVDFTNKRRFKSNAAKLLHAIDQASGDGSDVDSVNYPDKTILDKLAADSELAADEWFEIYKELPLVQDCLEAVNNGSFGGHFRQNLRAAITFASNQEGGIHFNNLLAMLGFMRNVGGLIPQRHDLQVLFREIIEDVSIGTDYRWFLLSFFLETLDDVDARSDRLGRIPKLFPHIGTDPLSSRLVREFFEDKGDLFSKLWRVSSSHYRESMARYAFKVGKWRKSPQLDDMAYLRDNSRTALASAATKWQGIAAFQTTDGELSAVYKELLDTNNTVSVRRIVELFENYSSVESEVAVHEMCNIADRVYARSLREAHGRQFLFQLHVGLVLSPYVDVLVSSLCLLSLVFECGIDSIRYHDAFPTCLMRKKEQGLFRQKSIVDGLVEQLAMDDNDLFPLLVFFNSIQWFPFDPFFASISVAMKEFEQNTSLTMVRDAMEGTISRADFAQYVNGKVQMHSG